MPLIKRCQPVSDKALKRMTLKNAQQWLINYGMAAEKVFHEIQIVIINHFIDLFAIYIFRSRN
jgi:sarcosine oxidase gamma subunit